MTARLGSLDALRGFNLFWIFYPHYPIFHFLPVAIGLGGCWLDVQMTHPEWNGLTFYDTIYPLFLFMSGVSFPFSLKKSRERGLSSALIVWKVVRRMILLYLLGMMIGHVLQLDFSRCTFSSVLGRIGITVGVASFLYMTLGWRSRLAVAAVILLAYGALPFLVAPPGGAPAGNPYASAEACLYGWVDTFFPKPQFYGGVTGLVPMVVTAMTGMFAGEWLNAAGIRPERKAVGLVAAGAAAMLASVVVAYGFGRWSVPYNKLIWSSSFTLVTAGWSSLLLALFYWIIDVRGFSRWSFVFKIIGVNSVFTYVASRSVFPFEGIRDYFFGGVMRLMPTPTWGLFVGNVGYMVLYWLLLYVMYRKKIFLKV